MLVVIVELLAKTTQRLFPREFQQAHLAEPPVPPLAAEEQPARAMLRRA